MGQSWSETSWAQASGCQSSLRDAGDPLPVPVHRAAGSGSDSEGFSKSRGWSKALSHQRYLALPVHETVALIKPKRSLN